MAGKRKRKVASLIERYLFRDFVEALAVPPRKRLDHLRAYVDRENRPWASHKGMRSMICDIYGVRRGLDPSDPPDWKTIKKGLEQRCDSKDLQSNMELARVLFDFVRAQSWKAYDDHPKHDMSFDLDSRRVPIDVQHHIIDDQRGAFQFVQTRATPFTVEQLLIAQSMIFHRYVRDDYSSFDVEIVDLSRRPQVKARGGVAYSGPRMTRVLRLNREQLLPKAEIDALANDVYETLLAIGDE